MGAHQSLKVVVVRRPRFQEFWQTFGQPLLQKAPKIEKSFTVKERVLFRGWGGAGARKEPVLVLRKCGSLVLAKLPLFGLCPSARMYVWRA
jgi:hypothetical protein